MRTALVFVCACAACGAPSAGSDAGPSDAGFERDANAAADAADATTNDAAAPPAEVDLLGCPQAGYAGTFDVGGAPFQLVVDTGSAELGVAAATCANCNVSPTYTPSAGATDEQATLSVSYVSGTGWSGEIIRDAFGAPASAISAPTRLVAIQSQSGGFFGAYGCDFGDTPFAYQGIAGFGPDSLAKAGTDAPMGALATSGVPDVFSFALCGSGGRLWLGGVDTSVATDSLAYTPLLDADDYYGIRVNDVSVGGASLGLTPQAIGDVVVDTDTTELELPSAVYDSLRDAIAGSSYFQAHFGTSSWFDGGYCTPPLDASPPSLDQIDAGLPTLTLAIDDGAGGSLSVTLGATDSYLQPIRKNNVLYYCPEIEPNADAVLGSAAMRGLLVVIDRAQARVGLATHATCAAP